MNAHDIGENSYFVPDLEVARFIVFQINNLIAESPWRANALTEIDKLRKRAVFKIKHFV